VVLLPLQVGEEGSEPGVLRAPFALVVGVGEEERSAVKAALAGAGQAGAKRREEVAWLNCQVLRFIISVS
jgi:hypothetical protein